MIKANIETKNGLKITIEGDPSDITDIIEDLQKREKRRDERLEFIRRMRKHMDKESREKRNSMVHGTRTSVTEILTKFVKEGFFDQPKKFRDVANRLEKAGIFIPSSTIHPVLSRLVIHGKLKRNKGDDDFWEYVKNG